MKKIVYGALALAFLCSACHDDDPEAGISGRVSENVVGRRGEVTYLSSVNILLTGNGVSMTAVTNAQGEYSFGGLQPGAYTLTYKLANYATSDTVLHIYNNVAYNVPMIMKFDFSGASGLTWTSSTDNLKLTFLSNMFTLASADTELYQGRYECNHDATVIKFHAESPEAFDFEADYLGEGSLYLFLPEAQAVNGKTRYCFYKNN